MNENQQAIELANRVLDKPHIDSDGDIALLARQFLRSREAAENYAMMLRRIARLTDKAKSLLAPYGLGGSPLRAASEPDIEPDMREAFIELRSALRFILAFYETGQRHLDTEAWKAAEAQARAALAKAETIA